jgi:hypothetical protein
VLSPLQERVARIVAGLSEADGFALAGGAALVVTHVVDRGTRDLDFFGPSADEVDRLVPAVESALRATGFKVRRERVSHGFARLTVVNRGEVTEVDLAADARIHRTNHPWTSSYKRPQGAAPGTLRGTQTAATDTDPSARSGPCSGIGAGQRTGGHTDR